jgi:hypothetical protein
MNRPNDQYEKSPTSASEWDDPPRPAGQAEVANAAEGDYKDSSVKFRNALARVALAVAGGM